MAHWSSSIAQIINSYHDILEDDPTPLGRVVTPEVIDRNLSRAYFDGVAQEQGCVGGGDILLHKYENHYFRIQMGLGIGTNTFAKLITL